MNINNTITNALSLTYNGGDITIPSIDRLNIYMGIGLWSLRKGLSQALPVDIMLMLLAAKIMNAKINEHTPERPSKVILLIADSLAIDEGANSDQVALIVEIYKRSLEPLLKLLKMENCCEIMLSSSLEADENYKEVLKVVDSSAIVQSLKIEDEKHHAYIRTQTAITQYMEEHQAVGIKTGWIYTESSTQLKNNAPPQSLLKWDELKFDRWHKVIYPESEVQYLYTKAGWKLPGGSSTGEGCPYTTFGKDPSYNIQMQYDDIKKICRIPKGTAKHWNGIADVCWNLMQAQVVSNELLPSNCIYKSNLTATVYKMLNHWVNAPARALDINSEQLSALPLDIGAFKRGEVFEGN